jgi:hypothetical protein
VAAAIHLDRLPTARRGLVSCCINLNAPEHQDAGNGSVAMTRLGSAGIANSSLEASARRSWRIARRDATAGAAFGDVRRFVSER